MALVPSALQGGLQPLNAPSPSGALTAQTIMMAFQGYAVGVQNMMGLPFIAMPAFSARLSALQASLSAPVPAGAMAAMNVATAINTAWSSVQTTFQTGPAVANIGQLQSALNGVFAAPVPAGSLFIMGLTNAIHAYCATTVITGVIPGVPPVPFSGPPI